MGERLQHLIDGARRDVLVLYLAARDPRVPFAAKYLAFVTAAYALSPIDLIPDFIPVLGLLDDVILIPISIWLIRGMIPVDVMDDLRAQATARIEPLSKSALGLIIVVSLWVVIAAAIWFWVVEVHD